MAHLTPEQLSRRRRFESLIRVISPALDLVLAVGDRISRIVEPNDHEYYPPRTSSAEPPPPKSARNE